jgi:hypothetical protein
VSAKWVNNQIPNDPVVQSNTRGYVSFAALPHGFGTCCRTTQVRRGEGEKGRERERKERAREREREREPRDERAGEREREINNNNKSY